MRPPLAQVLAGTLGMTRSRRAHRVAPRDTVAVRLTLTVVAKANRAGPHVTILMITTSQEAGTAWIKRQGGIGNS